MIHETRVIPVELLDAPPDNPNQMAPEVFETLVRLIQEEGFCQPILVRPSKKKGRFEVVDGDHRFTAIRQLNVEQVPCVILPQGYPDAKARVLQLALNKIKGDLQLADVAKSLQMIVEAGGIDATLSGYDQGEVDDLLKDLEPQDSLEDLLSNGAPKGGGGRPEEAKLYSLDLEFSTGEELKRAKKALKTAAAGGTLAQGLMNLIDR